jgi:hypothetical protein
MAGCITVLALGLVFAIPLILLSGDCAVLDAKAVRALLCAAAQNRSCHRAIVVRSHLPA